MWMQMDWTDMNEDIDFEIECLAKTLNLSSKEIELLRDYTDFIFIEGEVSGISRMLQEMFKNNQVDYIMWLQWYLGIVNVYIIVQMIVVDV